MLLIVVSFLPAMKNYYLVLGVQPTATADEIKAAYKALSKRVHPDVNWGGQIFEELFKDINEAYQVLSDHVRRSEYNQRFNHFFFAASSYSIPPQNNSVVQAVPRNRFRRKLFRNGIICLLLLLAFIAVNAFVFDDTVNSSLQEQKITGPAVASKKEPRKAKRIAVAAAKPASVVGEAKYSSPAIEPVTFETTEKIQAELDVLNATAVAPKTIAKQQWNEAELIAFVQQVDAERAKQGGKTKSVQLIVSVNCNIENAFDIARYLKQSGYIIAGRETTSKPAHGIEVDCSKQIMIVRIGAFK